MMLMMLAPLAMFSCYLFSTSSVTLFLNPLLPFFYIYIYIYTYISGGGPQKQRPQTVAARDVRGVVLRLLLRQSGHGENMSPRTGGPALQPCPGSGPLPFLYLSAAFLGGFNLLFFLRHLYLFPTFLSRFPASAEIQVPPVFFAFFPPFPPFFTFFPPFCLPFFPPFFYLFSTFFLPFFYLFFTLFSPFA